MNEMERDYLIARAFVAGFVDEAVKMFLTVVVTFVVLAIVGILLTFWPITMLLALVWAVCAYALSTASAPDAELRQTPADARTAMPTDVANVRGPECAIRTDDGEFIAPNFATLLQWVREGRVPPQSHIFTCDIGAWRIAYDVDQLTPLFGNR